MNLRDAGKVVRGVAICAALAALIQGAPALAGAYRVELQAPPGGRLLHGYGGLEAADERTGVALVRLISPGNDIHERGTIRALVMNLSGQPFRFGPDDVTLTLADGTVLKAVPVAQMEDGRELVERESRHAAAIDLQNRNSFSSLQAQANSGPTAQSLSPGAASPGTGVSGTGGQDHRTEESLLPGAELLDDIYQVLVPLSVGPRKAWGGYYVFDMPKEVFRRKSDMPLTVLIRTGSEVHRFAATLKWK
jgi:hypothetical protein